jgi:hypothetical protein
MGVRAQQNLVYRVDYDSVAAVNFCRACDDRQHANPLFGVGDGTGDLDSLFGLPDLSQALSRLGQHPCPQIGIFNTGGDLDRMIDLPGPS